MAEIPDDASPLLLVAHALGDLTESISVDLVGLRARLSAQQDQLAAGAADLDHGPAGIQVYAAMAELSTNLMPVIDQMESGDLEGAQQGIMNALKKMPPAPGGLDHQTEED